MTDAELVAGVVAGERAAIARALSAVEAEPGGALAAALYRQARGAHIIGVTGPPGVGKSSLIAALTAEWRRSGRRVGIVAVDPTSPYSGGAVLGDRVRMEAHLGDPGVFIRSLASRGQAGALAAAASEAVGVLDAAGFDQVLLETVGAGQSEVAVADACHTVLVVLAPGLGDEVQALKAGLLEIADVYAVNKADLGGAEADATRLTAVLGLGAGPVPPVLVTSAVTASGASALAAALDAHAAALRAGDGWALRDERRARAALERALVRRLVTPRLAQAPATLVAELAAHRTDPEAAARALAALPAAENGHAPPEVSAQAQRDTTP